MELTEEKEEKSFNGLNNLNNSNKKTKKENRKNSEKNINENNINNEQEKIVTFSYKFNNRNPQTVFISGSFDNWKEKHPLKYAVIY